MVLLSRPGAASAARPWAGLCGPELVDWLVGIGFGGEGDVFEAAVEGVVAADGGPVDSHGGIDGCFHVFRFDIALLGPAEIGGGGAVGVGGPDDLSARYSGAGEDDRLLGQMIAAECRCYKA